MDPFRHYGLLPFGWTKLRNGEEPLYDAHRIHTDMASSVESV